MELAKTSVTVTYGNSLAALRYQINQKLLTELSSSNNRRTRIINKSGTRGGGRGSIFQG